VGVSGMSWNLVKKLRQLLPGNDSNVIPVDFSRKAVAYKKAA